MNHPSTRKTSKLAILWRYAIAIASVWTFVLAGLCVWRLIEQRSEIREIARIQAHSSFEKDLVYRRWAAQNGGLYVPVTEATPPNPYLAHIENRDVTTTSGINLTLVNPAYMTRQVHEMALEQYGHQGHITSLNPIRPENAADPWETEALHAFEQGEIEVVSFELIGKEKYFRFMRPMVTEESCLKCHEVQGYQIGDIRGGISVSVPMSPLLDIERKQGIATATGYGLIWLWGVAGIVAVSLYSARRVRENEQAEKRLLQNQKLAAIGTLAAGVAHEINNPINGIMNYAQLIRDKSDSGSMHYEYSSEIIVESERVARVTSALLAFSRQESQSRSPARIADIVEAAVSLVRSSLLSEQILLDVDVPEDLPKVKCGSRQIQQVIMNLIMNAREALNELPVLFDGSKTIHISAHVFEREDEKWLRTTVEDHGRGIPPELKQRIFDPFFTTKNRAQASGLGLSTGQMIAQNHHGELSVETEPGEYTRFHLDLPIDKEEAYAWTNARDGGGSAQTR